MELRRYAQILRRRWVIASIAFLVTFFATLALVMPQPWFYTSTGSIVVVPRPGLPPDEAIKIAETLYNNPTIPATFAHLAGSDTMVARAKDAVQSSDPTLDTSDVKVETAVVIDTDVITIAVTDTDPDVAYAMSSALIEGMLGQTNLLDSKGKGSFQIQRFDAPNLPDTPAGPNKKLMIAAGLVLGALLALGLALLAEYLKRPAEELAIDDPVTGLRNELYLRERLHEEMSRTHRTRHSTAICLLRVGIRTGQSDDIAHAPTPRDLRRIARGLRLTVPDDAVLASLAGGIFVTLLPDVSRAKADGLYDGWEAAIRALLDWASQGEIGPRLTITGGTGEIVTGTLVGSAEVEAALRSLAGPDLLPVEEQAMLPGSAAQGALPEPEPEPGSRGDERPRASAPATPSTPTDVTVVIPEMPAAPTPVRSVARPAPTLEPESLEPESLEPESLEPESLEPESLQVSQDPAVEADQRRPTTRPSPKRRKAMRQTQAPDSNGDGNGSAPTEEPLVIEADPQGEGEPAEGDRVEASHASAREG